MTASTSDWPDLQFGVEDIKASLSRTTNGLFMQCTHALNWLRACCGGKAIEVPWKCSLRLMHSTNVRRRLVWNMEHFSMDNVRSRMHQLHNVRRSMHSRFELGRQSLCRAEEIFASKWTRITQTSCQPWTPHELV